jgi:hypothetical protein
MCTRRSKKSRPKRKRDRVLAGPAQRLQLTPLYNIVLQLEPKIRGVAYKFTPLKDFCRIDSIDELQIVYWGEIVQRLHACGATSLMRFKKWCHAAVTAYHADNYYGFCASLRGLIEACADTYYTINKVTTPVCENFAMIERALKGDAKDPLFSESIEEELIHYTHARKLSKAEKDVFQKSHDAKQVRSYMDSIDEQGVQDLYAELCQVSHPSAFSLVPFLVQENDDSPLMLHQVQIDRELNDDIMARHGEAIATASNLTVISAMCMLKLINEFDAPYTEALRTDVAVLAPAEQSGMWKDMAQKIDATRDG